MTVDGAQPTVGRAARALTADPAWLRNVAIGAGVNLIPYVGMFWFVGYALTYLRDAAHDARAVLPAWQPAGSRLKTGLFALVPGMVYSLPLSILFGSAMAAAVIGGVVGSFADGSFAAFAALLATVFGVFILASMLYGIVLWPVYVNVSLHGTIESGFDVKGIYARTREHATVFWPVAWRSVGLGLLSSVVGIGGLLLVIVGVVGGAAALLPSDARPLAVMLLLPAEVLGLALVGFVTVPLSLVTYRLWADYARIAYGLEAADPADAPSAS